MITSTGNSQIRGVIQLKKKPKERTARDLFIAEGLKMFLEAPAERTIQIYLSESFADRYCKESGEKNPDSRPVREKLEQTGYETVSDQVFAAMSDTKTPQGVICLIRQYHYKPEDLLAGKASPLCMVLENLQDPGNLGTIIRTGEGAGITGVLASSESVDVYNPKVIRSTMGSIYRVPVCYTDNLRGVLEDWKRKAVTLYAAHLKGSVPYDRKEYRNPTAFLIGNESRGLTEETAALADERIRIPMLGKVESLNAAVASAVLMYEAARQRRS